MTRQITKIDGTTFSAIIELMDDDLREEIHALKWPCSPRDFLAAYCNASPDFADMIKIEFGVEI